MQFTHPWEGVFWLDAFLQLKLPAGGSPEAAYVFLTRQIRRRPTRLELHLCRMRSAALVDQEALYAAVLDLFWVLGKKGGSLRQRVLRWTRERLAPSLYSALTSCNEGQLACWQLPFSPRSVFHDGRLKEAVELPLVVEAEAERIDLLTVARVCLEVGQLEQAREILEAQLKNELARIEVRQQLLEIYLATQDKEGFWQSYRWLETNGCLDEVWQAARTKFQ